MRLTRRNPVWSKIYTREDLLRTSTTDVDRIVSAGAGKRVPEYCEAIIDGGPIREPLWVIDKADVETMEIYTSRPRRQTNRASTYSNRTVPPLNECLGTLVYVWLRK